MPRDPLILGFDTSAAHCAAALLSGDQCLASAYEEMRRGQAEALVPLVQSVLAEGGAQLSDLTAIGVGIGPGNFTGIRLSVSTARGLALSLGIPAVGVSILDAVAHGTDGPVLACLSAPRDQAYLASHRMATPVDPCLMDIAEVPATWMEPGLTCVGSAADPVAAHLGAGTAPAPLSPAPAIAQIAAARWQTTTDRPAPLYMRAADAAPASDPPPVILP